MHTLSVEVNQETAAKLGLTIKEYQKIEQLLDREPNFTELCVFAVAWSEKCSGKSAALWLKTLPKEGKKILTKQSQRYLNLIDDLYLAASVSANYPDLSFFTSNGIQHTLSNNFRKLGARGVQPLAACHALRLGNLKKVGVQRQLDQALLEVSRFDETSGQASLDYDIYYNDSYNQNPVFNSCSFGFTRIKNKNSPSLLNKNVYLLGRPTQIEGNNAAIAFLQNERESEHLSVPFPTVDFYAEKRLMELSQELFKENNILAAESLDKGGLILALASLCFDKNMGFELSLEHLNQNTEGIFLEEFLLSETSGRMLIVTDKEKESLLHKKCEQWDLNCVLLGNSIPDQILNVKVGEDQSFSIFPEHLLPGGKAPEIHLGQKKPSYIDKASKFSFKKISHSKNYKKIAQRLVSSSNAGQKDWILDQLDSSSYLQNLSFNFPMDTNLLNIKEVSRRLAISLDGNPAYIKADPYQGALISIAEGTRNVIIGGGVPLAVLCAFNFGDPNNAHVYWQFVQTVKGINDACRKFRTPVLETDVSFYNQSMHKGGANAILPTPLIGVIGLFPERGPQIGKGFKEDGHLIYMIGTPNNDINASEYLRLIHSNPASPAPVFDLDEEYHIQQHLKKLIARGMIESAHDIMEGGLFVSLLECAVVYGYGFDIETDTNFRKDAYLFGESQSRVLVSIRTEREDDLVNYLNAQNVPFTRLGEVGGDEIFVDEENFGHVDEWKALSRNWLFKAMEMV